MNARPLAPEFAQGRLMAFPRGRTGWEPWVSKQQVAAHLGYSTRWIELRMHEGLPSRKMGGRRKFQLSAVEAWLEERFA